MDNPMLHMALRVRTGVVTFRRTLVRLPLSF